MMWRRIRWRVWARIGVRLRGLLRQRERRRAGRRRLRRVRERYINLLRDHIFMIGMKMRLISLSMGRMRVLTKIMVKEMLK